MGFLNIYCPHCGAENLRGPANCASCGESLQGASSKPPPHVADAIAKQFPHRQQNVGMVAWLLGACGLAAIGVVSLNQATMGVGLIGLSVVAAVFARIAQAGALHDRTERHREFLAKHSRD